MKKEKQNYLPLVILGVVIIIVSIFVISSNKKRTEQQDFNSITNLQPLPSVVNPTQTQPLATSTNIVSQGFTQQQKKSEQNDNSYKITQLENQYNQLYEQGMDALRLREIYQAAQTNAQLAGYAGSSATGNGLTQDDVNILGVSYSNLFRPQSSGNLQGLLLQFNSEISVKIQQNENLISSLEAQLQDIQSQINSLKK